MSRKVSLTLHKNTVEARNKRRLASETGKNVEKMMRETDVRAYAFVGIKADGQAVAAWDTGGIIPMWCFAEAIHTVLNSDMQNSGVQEDFKAPIVGAFPRVRK